MLHTMCNLPCMVIKVEGNPYERPTEVNMEIEEGKVQFNVRVEHSYLKVNVIFLVA